MGFFEKFKRKKDTVRKSQTIISPAENTALTVFFNRQDIDAGEIEAILTERFGAKSILSIDSSHLSVINFMLRIDGIDVMCSYIPFPLPKEECDIFALFDFNHHISEEEQKALVEHKSFCLLTEIGGGKTLAGKRTVCLILTKLCGCFLNIQSAVGVYCNAVNLLLGKKMYLNYASISEREEKDPAYFPTMLWILVCQIHTDDGVPTVETCGLEQFGFLELQLYRPTEDWAYSYEKLHIMALLQITGKEIYKNMDTIFFTQDTLSVFKQNGNKLAIIGGI